MATFESDTLVRTKGEDGKIIIHYPITKGKNVLLSDEMKALLEISLEEGSVEDALRILSNAPPDFDNLLAWPNCKRITPPKDETTNTYTETIVHRVTGALRAKRVTVQNGENDYTETYTFYEADGVTQKARYVVQTAKDETETWTEDVTKEAAE